MADDLGDDWWKEDSSNDDDDEKIEDKEDMETSVPEQPQKDKDQKKKRKRNRKRITDELKEKGDKPGRPEDFVGFLDKHFGGKLTAVERDEIALDTEKNFYAPNQTPAFSVAYLRSVLPKWKKMKIACEGQGSPMLLVICAAALRAVDLNRQLQDFKGDKCKCAKLFAKHMKLGEQQTFLKKSVCHMGIGTPNRILALVKSGHLKLDNLTAIVIDWNYRDIKKHRVADIPEIRAELATLLKTYLIPHIKSSDLNCKIGML
ncbi:protein CMSS1-like isoform X2 [Ruditapes philippinarum]|uniref:protein CMSS1-like isoform X2 n=1 Tax=Ruditapes philippinarum TaxID=129788 RepID=UPI00295B4454|nr:protein CMSS1-like isoform X2 [Ruditapes philippinarum]